jgi:hypothetical protein
MIITSFFIAGIIYTFAAYGIIKSLEPNNVVVIINNNENNKQKFNEKNVNEKNVNENLIDL